MAKTVQAAGVDTYKERPDASRSVEENVAAEGRALREDQITNYHEENPTLDNSTVPSQAEIDKAVAEAAAAALPKVTKADAKAAVDEATV